MTKRYLLSMAVILATLFLTFTAVAQTDTQTPKESDVAFNLKLGSAVFLCFYGPADANLDKIKADIGSVAANFKGAIAAVYVSGNDKKEDSLRGKFKVQPNETAVFIIMPSGKSGAKIVPSKLSKSMTFIQVTEAVISNLEGGYFHPDMAKDGRLKPDPRYDKSGETMFGLDRRQGDTTSSAAKQFWAAIDTAGARSKWKWGYMPKQPLYGQLVTLAAGVIEPKFNKHLIKSCPDKNLQDIIKSDGRLLFNVIYSQWNGDGYIVGLLKLLTQEYNNGKKTADALLKVAVAERVSGGYRIYNLGTGRNLAAKYASLNSQGGHKIAKLTGVQIA